jgi:hypothetical protein
MTSASGERFLKSLLGKIPQEAFKAVTDTFPQEIAARINALPSLEENLSPQSFFIQPKILLSAIHSTWYEDVVASCSDSLRPIALQAIREEMMESLDTKKLFSDQVRKFLLQISLSLWPEKDMKRNGKAIFTPFKDSSAEFLCSLADLVCLYDLVDDIKKTVDKKKLQKILSRLSLVQQRYIKILLQKAKSPSFLPFDIESFLLMSAKEAALALRKNGFEKLGWLLKKEEDSTVWHVLHMMDKQDAAILQEGKNREKVVCDFQSLQKLFYHTVQFLREKVK